jgi:HK97 family phage prohead protease
MNVLFGTAIRFGDVTPDPVGGGGGREARREMFAPGAFGDALHSTREVRLLQNHDDGQQLATTQDGSLRVFEAVEGLKFYATAPSDLERAARFKRTASLVKQRLVTGVSIRFVCGDWEYTRVDGQLVRKITTVASLEELSILQTPAYPLTRVYVGNAVPPVFMLREELDALSR